MLFKAKPCLEEEKSPLLVQSAKTEMGGSMQNCDGNKGTKHVGPETRTQYLRKCLGFVWQSTKSLLSPSSVTSRIWYAQPEQDHQNQQCQ